MGASFADSGVTVHQRQSLSFVAGEPENSPRTGIATRIIRNTVF